VRRWQGAALIAAGGVIWGSNGVIANRIDADPVVIVFFRVGIAAAVLAVLLAGRRRWDLLQARGRRLQLGALGGLLASTWICLFTALKALPIGVAVLLNYLAPILVAALSPALLKETVTPRAVISLGFSLVGIVLVSGVVEGTVLVNLGGVSFGLLAALTYALFIVFSKRVLTVVSSETLAFYTYLAAALLLSPTPFLVGLPCDLSAYLYLLVLGVVNTAFAVTLYFVGLRHVRAQDAAVLAYLEPVSALFFGWFFLEQSITFSAAVGGLLIVLAGFTVALEDRRADQKSEIAEGPAHG